MNVSTLLKTYTDAQQHLAALPSSDRKGLEAASARLHEAAEALIITRARSIEDLAAKIAFISQEHEAENDATVARGLNSLRADLNQLSA